MSDATALHTEQPRPLPLVEWLSLIGLGWFFGLMLGGALHNGLGAFGPISTEPGTVQRLEVEYSGTNRTTTNRDPSYVLVGSTDDGDQWRIVDTDAYRVVEAEGYPQTVRVGFGDWTGNAERVEGATWVASQRTTGSKIFVGVMLGVLTLAGLLTMVILARNRRYGPLAALAFGVPYFVLGGFTGELLFGWFQSA